MLIGVLHQTNPEIECLMIINSLILKKMPTVASMDHIVSQPSNSEPYLSILNYNSP